VLFCTGAAPPGHTPCATLEPPLAALLAAIAEGHDTAEQLAAVIPGGAPEVFVGLTHLEFRDLVRRGPGGRYEVVP
jgi:hypothetical protein